MLQICEYKHEPLAFNGDSCPACAARDAEMAAVREVAKLVEEIDDNNERISKMEQEISELEGTIEDLNEEIYELKHK